MRKVALVVGVFCLMALAGSAFAGVVQVAPGGGDSSGDWQSQYLMESSPFSNAPNSAVFNAIKITLVSGGPQLSVPAMTGFSDGSWSQASGNTTTASETGNAVNSLDFYFDFADPPPATTVLGFQALYNGSIIDQGIATFSGTSFSSWQAVPVPEPVSMIFFGTGLVAVGGYVARRRMLSKA